MDDIGQLILDAWKKLGPRIMRDSDELNRRLARRRMKILTQPVRAWCLAVRASDRRIGPGHWVIVPEHAMEVSHPEHPYEAIEHQVIIQTHALRKYCRPVRTDSWGELVGDVAKRLGCSPAALLNARRAGKFTERLYKGLGGKHCKYPIPLIHCWDVLDPSGYFHFSKPDVLWGGMWPYLADMIPDDFEQAVTRRPVFSKFGGGAIGRPKVRAPSDHGYKDETWFRGWKWVCPACKKEVKKIYYPLRPQTVFDYLGYDPARSRRRRAQSRKYLPYDVEDVEAPVPTFACFRCHGIQSPTRLYGAGWNVMVSVMTRGMLYGHEVKRPDWYHEERKKARDRKLGRVAVKREAVLRRLLNGWTYKQIARDLLINMPNLARARRIIYAHEGVKDRVELGRKLGSVHEQPLNLREHARARRERVLGMLLEGLSHREIAQREGILMKTVNNDALAIKREHGVKGRVSFDVVAEKMGVKRGGKYAARRKSVEEVRRRFLAGEKKAQIARELGLSFSEVVRRCGKILREKETHGASSVGVGVEVGCVGKNQITGETPVVRTIGNQNTGETPVPQVIGKAAVPAHSNTPAN
jgi:DNA-binding NarL/FixJ family response regulator